MRASDSVSSHGSDDEADRFARHDENQLSSSPEPDDDFSTLHDAAEGERKSAFYDYKQEKALRQADAKLFYQPQQGHASSVGWNSPVLRASTWGGGGNLSRADSVVSISSLQHQQTHGTHSGPTGKPVVSGRTPTGMASLDKSVDKSEVQMSSIGRFDPHGVLEANSRRSGMGGQQTTGDAQRPAAPSVEATGSYASRTCVHGRPRITSNELLEDPTLTAELSAIYTNIQKVLDLRHKYMRVSLQGASDNPKDDPRWNIYPPPPPPVWIDEPVQTPDGASSFQTTDDPEKSFWAGSDNRNRDTARKPGQDIGEDFMYAECEIPQEDEMDFKLDGQGVFQVYENKKGTCMFTVHSREAHPPNILQLWRTIFR